MMSRASAKTEIGYSRHSGYEEGSQEQVPFKLELEAQVGFLQKTK